MCILCNIHRLNTCIGKRNYHLFFWLITFGRYSGMFLEFFPQANGCKLEDCCCPLVMSTFFLHTQSPFSQACWSRRGKLQLEFMRRLLTEICSLRAHQRSLPWSGWFCLPIVGRPWVWSITIVRISCEPRITGFDNPTPECNKCFAFRCSWSCTICSCSRCSDSSSRPWYFFRGQWCVGAHALEGRGDPNAAQSDTSAEVL